MDRRVSPFLITFLNHDQPLDSYPQNGVANTPILLKLQTLYFCSVPKRLGRFLEVLQDVGREQYLGVYTSYRSEARGARQMENRSKYLATASLDQLPCTNGKKYDTMSQR
jgi:hypothetical protein